MRANLTRNICRIVLAAFALLGLYDALHQSEPSAWGFIGFLLGYEGTLALMVWISVKAQIYKA